MAGYQVDEPSNDFVEFVQVWSRNGTYPEAIILFKSPRGEFDVQVGHKIDEEPVHNARHLTILTSAGSVVEIQRKKRGIGSWFTTDLKPLSQFITKNFLLKETSIEDTGWSITVDRTDLLSQELIWMTTNEVEEDIRMVDEMEIFKDDH